MDISNSGGDSTGYRIMGSGAAPCPPTKAESCEAESSVAESWKEVTYEEFPLGEVSLEAATPEEKAGKGNKGRLPVPAGWRVVCAGNLSPHEYVTESMESMPDASACVVDFELKDRTLRVRVPAGKYKELLLALVPNGTGAPKPFVCRKRA